MKKNIIHLPIALIVVWSLSSPAAAHGHHAEGAFGTAFNLWELGKHALVVVDQVKAGAKRSWPLLAGNAISGVAHGFHVKSWVDHAAGRAAPRYQLPLFAAATVITVLDMAVDAGDVLHYGDLKDVLTRQYWSDASLEEAAGRTLIALPSVICLVMNLNMAMRMIFRPLT